MITGRSLFCIIFIMCSLHIYGQEICDNGVDDDGDMLVDLNDEDCICQALIPTSLIPNNSFEDMTCCPIQNAQLDCAVGWVQASAPTTDYVHTCNNYLGNTSIPAFAPLPFPDGEGAVGFRDGQRTAGPNYKEYVGACLNESMIVGDSYKLDFFVGFRDNIAGSLNFKMAIFASTNCNNLPFSNNASTGCPTNAGGYVQLGELDVQGSNEWINVQFEFEATQAYNTMVLGPSCETNPNWMQDPYFYVDRLVLAESQEFGVPYENISGQICENNLVLSVEENTAYTYQWYLDGIAIVGSTTSQLSLSADNSTEGTYLVVVNTPSDCFYSSEYDLRIPPYYDADDQMICEGSTYAIGDTLISTAGQYNITIDAADGCDSIIELTLDILPTSVFSFQDQFCEGQTYEFLGITTQSPGIYMDTLINSVGCDSIITLVLDMKAQNSGLSLVSNIDIDLGETIDIIPSNIDGNIVSFSWIDPNGVEIESSSSIQDFTTLNSTTLTLFTTDINGCSQEFKVEIRVDKSNIKLFIPNIFTPDGNGVNDRFGYFANESLKSILRFEIYDRWGERIFSRSDFPNNSSIEWTGEYKGERLSNGVYTYLIEAQFLDDSIELYIGDVTLLR